VKQLAHAVTNSGPPLHQAFPGRSCFDKIANQVGCSIAQIETQLNRRKAQKVLATINERVPFLMISATVQLF